MTPQQEQPPRTTYVTFQDEDGRWCVVTDPLGEYVAYPEMDQECAEHLAGLLNRAATPEPAPGLDVERLAQAVKSRYGLKESEAEVAIFLHAIIGTGRLSDSKEQS